MTALFFENLQETSAPELKTGLRLGMAKVNATSVEHVPVHCAGYVYGSDWVERC